MVNPPIQPKPDRLTAACRNCRSRKVRCSGGQPCRDCQRLKKDCFYPLVQRRTKKAKHSSTSFSDQGPTVIVENGVAAQESDDGTTNSNIVGPRSNSDLWEYSTASHIVSSLRGESTVPEHPRDEASASDSAPNFTDDVLGSEHTGNSLRGNNWEYHEPWSWMSICSRAACKCIQDLTGDQSFSSIADRFTVDLASRWSSEDVMSAASQRLQIEEETAWEYTNAFFNDAWEAKLAIVHRHDFEAHLKEYFHQPIHKGHLAWFALRNTVFACGYRCILTKDPTVSFAEAQTKAGRYFNNGLSVLTQILLPPSSLLAIQAMALMACYSEGLGNPALKHFLCANAVHAAQNKGLHRQPEKSWGISETEVIKRNGLWWTIYSLEKHLAMCSGRPSAIDDDNVTTCTPTQLLGDADVVSQSLIIATRHAQICSQISRNLLSARSLQLSTSELINTVDHFHQKLTKLLDDIPDALRIGTLARPNHSIPHLTHLLYLHFSIYGSIMVVHTHFFYPWMSSRLTAADSGTSLEEQIALSSNIVAEAARKIILAVRLVTTTAATPSWLAFYYPIYAHINLFLYILKYPGSPTTAADLGLLDVCAGHFGYIDYLTSTRISISLPRETATLASKLVKSLKANAGRPTARIDNEKAEPSADLFSRGQVAEFPEVNFGGLDSELPTISDAAEFLDFDATTWNVFSTFDMMTAATVPEFGTFPP